MKTKRDGWFWLVVGGLALGTALSTAYFFSPSAHGQPLRPHRSETAESQPATHRSSATEASAPAPRSAPSAHRSSRRSFDDGDAAEVRRDPEQVRRILTEHIRATRQRQQLDGVPSAPVLDEASRMPLMAMSWQQYRRWVKFADALAERDYRAVDLVLSDTKDSHDETTREVLIDALVDDYRGYLGEVIEGECDGLEPQSLWRKTIFMSLLLAKLERQSVELGDLEQQAQRACGF